MEEFENLATEGDVEQLRRDILHVISEVSGSDLFDDILITLIRRQPVLFPPHAVITVIADGLLSSVI